MDGDRRLDRFTSYTLIDGDSLRWRVELADGSIIDEPADDEVVNWQLVGATDIRRDGSSEIWVDLGGATAFSIGLAVFEDCAMKFVQNDGFFPDGFLWAASGLSSRGVTVGVECSDVDGDGVEEIVETEQHEALPADDYSPTPKAESWQYAAYRLDGDRARLIRRDAGPSLEAAPSFLRWSAHFYCPSARKLEPSVDYFESSKDKDCADFTYQDDAQLYFDATAPIPPDPDHLDGDGDKVVCEALPVRPTLQSVMGGRIDR